VPGLDATRAGQPADYRSDSDVSDPDLAGEAPYRSADPVTGPATPLGAESDGTDEAQDVVDVLLADHREVERLFAEIEAAAGDRQRREDLVNVVVAELMRHSAAEEQYLYPAARRHLPDGDRIADHELAEHARAEEVMKALLKRDGDDDGFDQLVSKLMSEIRHHVEEEETDLFPKLRQSCDRQTLVDVGTEIISAKRLAPTRPHPAAPDTPPFNKVTGPLTGLVDRAVDALTDRPTSVEDLTDRNR
jgi:hemerythrin superfamily protein